MLGFFSIPLEFPKTGGPRIDPNILKIIVKGTSRKGPQLFENSPCGVRMLGVDGIVGMAQNRKEGCVRWRLDSARSAD